MELTKISNQELLGRLDKLVRTERKITHVILVHINEVESRRLYAELGFDSMFKYLTRHCGYGEDSAYRRLQAARLLRKNPEIAEKIEDGSLNLTQLTQVQKCLKHESKMGVPVGSLQTLQILEQLQNKNSYETKKVLAVEFNQPIQTHEVIKPQQDDSVRLGLTLNSEQMKTLTQARDLLSHALPDGNLAEVIFYLAKQHIQKVRGKSAQEAVLPQNQVGNQEVIQNENQKAVLVQNTEGIQEVPQLKPSTQRTRASTLDSTPASILSSTSFLVPTSMQISTRASTRKSTPSFTTARKRSHIKITDKRKLLQKANHSCEFRAPTSNTQCQSTYQLQIDHKIPLAKGGSNSESNLRVLCRTHNLHEARKWGLL